MYTRMPKCFIVSINTNYIIIIIIFIYFITKLLINVNITIIKQYLQICMACFFYKSLVSSDTFFSLIIDYRNLLYFERNDFSFIFWAIETVLYHRDTKFLT